MTLQDKKNEIEKRFSNYDNTEFKSQMKADTEIQKINVLAIEYGLEKYFISLIIKTLS